MNRRKVFFLVIVCVSVFLVVCCLLIERQKDDNNIRAKIGQMLIVGFRGTEINENSFIVKAIQDLNLSGVILFDIDGPTKDFPRNIINAEQVKELVKRLKTCAPSPLMVAVDAEGGRVNRLKPAYGFVLVPSHQELGEKDDLSETQNVSLALAKELSELGVNTNFAPVVDVNVNTENPVIGLLGRSFSSDPQKVARHAKAFIEGQHAYGIVTALKHFPGHGSSRADSHKGLVDVTATYQDKELVPYQALIKDNVVDMVMTAHIMNKKIDAQYPATLSDHYIKEILREQLGFQGVVVSDDMQMGAISEHYGLKEAVVRAVNAGCDLLIISNNGRIYDEHISYQVSDILFQAVKNKEIPKSRIAESAKRIKHLKEKLASGPAGPKGF